MINSIEALIEQGPPVKSIQLSNDLTEFKVLETGQAGTCKENEYREHAIDLFENAFKAWEEKFAEELKQWESGRIWKEMCRYNSGAHFLDSGGAYGRHHEKPEIPDEAPHVWFDDWTDCPATLATWHVLEQSLEVIPWLNVAFHNWCADTDEAYLELEPTFCEVLGLESVARDNTYNSENDLSQDYIWNIWERKDERSEDWIYGGGIATIAVHTGCDVRGGYAPPVFACSTGEYAAPLDIQCGYYMEGRNGEDHPENDCGRFSVGYSSYPWAEVEKEVERFVEPYCNDKQRVARCKDGRAYRIYADWYAC